VPAWSHSAVASALWDAGPAQHLSIHNWRVDQHTCVDKAHQRTGCCDLVSLYIQVYGRAPAEALLLLNLLLKDTTDCNASQ